MTFTWERHEIRRAFTGDDGWIDDEVRRVESGGSAVETDGAGWYVDAVTGQRWWAWSGVEDEPVTLLVETGSTGRDTDPADALESVLGAVEDEGPQGFVEGSGSASLACRLPDLLAISLQSNVDYTCPEAYLEALCDALAARGWSGRLRLPPRVATHLDRPGGSEETITTVLDVGRREVRRTTASGRPMRSHFQPLWHGDVDLARRIAAMALAWVEGADGTTVVDAAGLAWELTGERAVQHLTSSLAHGAGMRIERSALGERGPDGRATCFGRTARTSGACLLFTEHQPERPLADRLAGPRALLETAAHPLHLGYVAAPTGFGTSEQDREPATSLPDAHWTQVFPTDWLPRAGDLATWLVEVRADGLVEVTHPARDGWFPAHAVDPSVREQARSDLADLLTPRAPQQPA